MSGNPIALTLEHPLDLDDGRRAARRLADQRREAEEQHKELVADAADAERDYRKAYAQAFIQAEGTAGEREAKAKADSADEAYERDLKAGLAKVAAERLRGLEGERSMLKTIMEWSMKLDPVAERQPRQAA